MAESLQTKKAIAEAFKKLSTEIPMEKISIGEICAECGLNRKSFYYHYKDKFDLINRIFDTEFLSVAAKRIYADKWEAIEDLCTYLYANKRFYKQAMTIEDHAGFANHLKDLLKPILKMRLQEITGNCEISKFVLDFYTDAFIFTIGRWLLSHDALAPDEFISELKNCIYISSSQMLKT